jgi:O-methyltransferase
MPRRSRLHVGPGHFQQVRQIFLGWVRRLETGPGRAKASCEALGETVFYAEIMKYVEFNRLQGDYAEFGIYKGASFISSYTAADRLNLPQMRFFAFDSFQGLPNPVGPHNIEPFRAGAFSAPAAVFEKALERARVNLERVVIIPGWFDLTLSPKVKVEHRLKNVAVAWIDCDLYESTVPVLEFLVSILEEGAILVFRDWYCYRGDPNKGEQRAVREWLTRYPDVMLIPYRSISWNGEAFLFRRGASVEADPRMLRL